jgi:hypothetical protein
MDGLIRLRTLVVVLPLVLAIGGTTACMLPPEEPLAPASAVRFTGSIISRATDKIAGARLTVLNGVNKDAHVTTDADGHYVFASLQPDSFDVLIEAAGFASITPRVSLFKDVDATFALSPQ